MGNGEFFAKEVLFPDEAKYKEKMLLPKGFERPAEGSCLHRQSDSRGDQGSGVGHTSLKQGGRRLMRGGTGAYCRMIP